MSLIINADDFGWTDGQNLAVEKAHCHGILNRASILTNGQAFRAAVEISQRLPDLGVGVHLTLNEGRPLRTPDHLPNLTRADGSFHERLGTIESLWLRGRLLTEEVLPEWRAQIQRAIEAGIQVTHLDSHKHVHMFPPVLDAFIELAREYQIPYVRLPLEKISLSAFRRGPAWLGLWLLARRARSRLTKATLRFADRFIGIAASGSMTAPLLARAVASCEGVTEIMVHPAVITPAITELQESYGWARRYLFEEELHALCEADIGRPATDQ